MSHTAIDKLEKRAKELGPGSAKTPEQAVELIQALSRMLAIVQAAQWICTNVSSEASLRFIDEMDFKASTGD